LYSHKDHMQLQHEQAIYWRRGRTNIRPVFSSRDSYYKAEPDLRPSQLYNGNHYSYRRWYIYCYVSPVCLVLSRLRGVERSQCGALAPDCMGLWSVVFTCQYQLLALPLPDAARRTHNQAHTRAGDKADFWETNCMVPVWFSLWKSFISQAQTKIIDFGIGVDVKIFRFLCIMYFI